MEHIKEKDIKRLLYQFGQYEPAENKAWVIDQIARIVFGDTYDDFIFNYQYGDGIGGYSNEVVYKWDCGIKPEREDVL